MKRLFGLLFFFSLFLTTAVFATESRTITIVETSVFEAIDETTSLHVLPAGTPVTVLERLASHTLVRTDSVEGYIRNEDVVTATSRYVARETYAVDANGGRVAYLPFGTKVDVYDRQGSDLVETIDGTYIARDALSETIPVAVTETRYAKQAAPVFSKPETGDPIRHVEIGETLTVAGDIDGYARLQTADGYAYIALGQLSSSPVKVAQRFVVTNTRIYSDLTQTSVLGSLPRGQRINVYGTTGALTRIYAGGRFVFIETAHTSMQMPTYQKSGQRYVQQDTNVYFDVDRSKIVATLKRGQLVNIYGTEGALTRVFVRGQFVYVDSKDMGTTKPTYKKTGGRYIMKQTPIYQHASSTKVVGAFKRGQLVNIYGTEGAYTRVFVNGIFYFVPTNVIGTTKPPLFDSTGNRFVKFNNVSVYATASTTSRVTRLKRGQVVETFGTNGYYTRVRVGSQYRYMATAYLTLNKPLAKPKAGTVFYVQLDGTPHFSTDVAYARPAGTLKRGTRLVGSRSIDDDFWQVRLPNGKSTYVLNPYIATTQPKAIRHTSVNVAAHYATTKRTPFYANPNDTRPSGYLDTNRRVYPRSKSGDSYLIQYNWRPVYVKVSDIQVKVDPLLAKRGHTQQERLVAAAVRHLGTPYTWGSQSPLNGGFDCSGLVHYAANQAGKVGGRTNVAGYWSSNHFKNKRTAITSGRRGDIIFFAGTYRNGPSHIGIMLDNEFFIHAGGETLQINSIYDPQWRTYFLGYKSL
ncbi:hypothetical protein EVJ20_07625 [Exiguobacterium sp. SH0S1]|uniref:C40 family peptidase n=1 Tax=Exiguobacterium sp. SH0S1 TaxID=2510949 RepID=UPI0010388780|nr:C40 family peptidase [Exiguobacterium sp. SH0S1]TCI77822.1 hypothetical protein EVJ20_07625 [Exiguobacterium sp. SH0S1]